MHSKCATRLTITRILDLQKFEENEIIIMRRELPYAFKVND
jgi:hypothetical protein